MQVSSNAIGCVISIPIGYIRDIFYTIDVVNYDELKRSYIRIEFKDSVAIKLGNIIYDKWFDLKHYKID
jgi:hypothetical protein